MTRSLRWKGTEDAAKPSGYAVGMRVRVLFFGVLTEALGRRERLLELSEGATVADLVSVLRGDSSNHVSEGLWGKMAVAVNREYAKRERLLCEGDEVALLPPVSGGCGAHREAAAESRR